MEQYERILGCLAGAAVGDAMGAVTETRTTEMILERFGKYVDDLLPGEADTFMGECPAGTVTDDFSLAWCTAQAILDTPGDVDDETAKRALITWSDNPAYFRMAGPTTASAILALRGEAVNVRPFVAACDNSRASNGAAMKISPAGLRYPGDPDKAIRAAATLCKCTHNNTAAISGAAAVAAAVSVAVTGAGLQQVLDAAFYGARRGMAYGKPVSVASVERRMELAVAIARQGMDWEKTMLELGSVVGAGLAVNEAVPCAFGVLEATKGDVMSGIKMGVNIGNDTDTVATIVGAIAGAMCGADAIPARHLEMICRVNGMDLPRMAKAFEEAYYQ